MNCPHCDTELTMIETPPLSKWAGVEIDVCMNNMCSYFLGSWKVLSKQGAVGGYRYYHDTNGSDGAMAVGSVDAFQECIVTPEVKASRQAVLERVETEYKKLTQAISHAEEVAESVEGECREDHLLLAKWLKELKNVKFPNG